LSQSFKNLSNVPAVDLAARGFRESNELLGNTKYADATEAIIHLSLVGEKNQTKEVIAARLIVFLTPMSRAVTENQKCGTGI
jgi:hypothetical protein